MITEARLKTFLADEWALYLQHHAGDEPAEAFVQGIQVGMKLAEQVVLESTPQLSELLVRTILETLSRKVNP